MKENELMQGDLVLYEYNGEKIHARVVEIYRSSALVESVSKEYEPIEIAEDKLFPVAIIPEILEKNGFVEIKDYDPYVYYLLKAGRFSISLEHCFDSFDNEDYWSCSISNRKSDATLSVHTIHELQHALRLCGIEKEIEL